MLRISAPLEPSPGGRGGSENSHPLVFCTPGTFSRHSSSSQITDLTKRLYQPLRRSNTHDSCLYLQMASRLVAPKQRSSPSHTPGWDMYGEWKQWSVQTSVICRLMWVSESPQRWEKGWKAELRLGFKQYGTTRVWMGNRAAEDWSLVWNKLLHMAPQNWRSGKELF